MTLHFLNSAIRNAAHYQVHAVTDLSYALTHYTTCKPAIVIILLQLANDLSIKAIFSKARVIVLYGVKVREAVLEIGRLTRVVPHEI